MYFKRCTNGEWALLSALQGISTSQTIAGLHWAENITRKVKVQERTFTTDHNHSFFSFLLFSMGLQSFLFKLLSLKMC